MPTIADLMAVGVEIGFEGKVYKLREPNVYEQGEFQAWLAQQAKEEARRDVHATEEEIARQIDRINDRAAEGVYEFGGELAVNALTRMTPITQLLFIVLSKDYHEVTLEMCKRMMDRNAREIVAGLAAKVVTDPNEVRATLVSLGLPANYLDSLIPGQNGGESSFTSPTPHSATPPTRSEDSPTPNYSDSTEASTEPKEGCQNSAQETWESASSPSQPPESDLPSSAD